MGLADTGRSEKQECADRLCRVLQTYAVALYSLDNLLYGIVLTYYLRLDSRSHLAQTLTFGLGYALDGHAGHHGHNLSHLVLIDSLAHGGEFLLPLGIGRVELRLELLLTVTIGGGLLKVLSLGGT